MTTKVIDTFDNVSISKISFNFPDVEGKALVTDCVGKLSAETEMQEIVKKAGATEIKKLAKPTKMTATVTAHVPVAIFRKFYGLHQNAAVRPGIYSYGPSSKGQKFALGATVLDEFEDNSKLLGFLNCASTSGLTFEIENGADEVAALELECGVMIDELNEFYHEAIVQELDEDLSEKWMSELSADVLKAATTDTAPKA